MKEAALNSVAVLCGLSLFLLWAAACTALGVLIYRVISWGLVGK